MKDILKLVPLSITVRISLGCIPEKNHRAIMETVVHIAKSFWPHKSTHQRRSTFKGSTFKWLLERLLRNCYQLKMNQEGRHDISKIKM